MKPTHLQTLSRFIKLVQSIIIVSFLTVPLFGAEIYVTSRNNSGSGTLRKAVEIASSGDTILIRTTGTIKLYSPITINRNLTIIGKYGPLSHTVSGRDSNRIFEITCEGTVKIAGLTFKGGHANGGGAIKSNCSLLLENSRFLDNSATGNGGAIYQTGGSLTVDRCYFNGNSATGHGGALAASDTSALTIRSTGFGSHEKTPFQGNHAGGSGGAIWAALSESSMEIRSSTLANNYAIGPGGGFYVESGSARGINLTLIENLAGDDYQSHFEAASAASMEILDSIMEDSEMEEAQISEVGNNLIGAMEDLGLGEMDFMGGISPTFPVLPGSRAIDASNSGLLGPEERDQRGLARFSDGDGDGLEDPEVADLGAFEIQHYKVSNLHISGFYEYNVEAMASSDAFKSLTLEGEADVADAVRANNAAGGGSVSFDSAILPGRSTLRGSDLDIRKNLAIYGPGADLLVLDGDGRSRIFSVEDRAKVLLKDLTIENGRDYYGGGILVDDDSSLDAEGVSIRNNVSTNEGGGIAVISGKAYIFRSSLVGNRAAVRGGAIYSNYDDPMEVILDTSTIANNTAPTGGAVVSARKLVMDSVAIVNNSSPAVLVQGPGFATFRNSIFQDGGNPPKNSIATIQGGTVVSEGYNISDADFHTLVNVGDQRETNADLGPLALNGGTTFSTAPTPNSPAVNQGFTEFPPYLDQPGFPRIQGGTIDVGPVEYQNNPPVVECVSGPIVLECSGSAGATLASADFIVSDPDDDTLTVTWTLGNGETIFDQGQVTNAPVLVSLTNLNAPLGTSILSVTVSDSHDSSTCEISITVEDTTPPVVTLNGATFVTLECGSSYTEVGATVTDLCEGVLGAVTSGAKIPWTPEDTSNLVESFALIYTATDSFGNEGQTTRYVAIVDSTKPAFTAPENIFENADPTTCDALIFFSDPTAIDCSGVTFSYSIAGTGIISSPHTFPEGSTVVDVVATDTYGNQTSSSFSVTISDVTPPVLEFLDVDGLPTVTPDLVVECGIESYVEFGASAFDACDGETSVIITNNFPESGPLALGNYVVTYEATDAAGNKTTTYRNVEVVDTTGPAFQSAFFNDSTIDLTEQEGPIPVSLTTDNGLCSKLLEFLIIADDACDSESPTLTYRILANEVYPESEYPEGKEIFEPTFNFAYRTGGITHQVECTATDFSGNQSTIIFEVTVTDPDLNCINNISWPTALPLQVEELPETSGTLTLAAASSPTFSFATVQQYIGQAGQSRWYKFAVQPGSRVTVLLTDLPENYDMVVYRDIRAEFQRILELFNSANPEDNELALLGAEFAPESFSPESFSPESFSPESFSPESFSPESFSPESFSPESFSPESFSPESFSPESFSPESFSPESFSPESFSPESFSPESFSPESFSPESFSPESFSPESFSPESFSPESFSAAQVSSMIGFSAFPGVASEGISINTFTATGDFYVRVRGYNGAYNVDEAYTLSVTIESGLCEGVGTETFGNEPDLPGLPAPTGNGYNALILWDSERILGSIADIDLLRAKLDLLAFTENGVVVDVSKAGRVRAANVQADDKRQCPYAKNLVAGEIKDIIDSWRKLNPGMEYIVLIGNDESIPFFRTDDDAFLANESNYIPPVIDNSHSQASLREGQILTQDPYGAACEVNLATGPFPYPDMAVGRLVESISDIVFQIDNYLSIGGVIEPASALVTGYDFLWDVAIEVQSEFGEALGLPPADIDSLIVTKDTPPQEGWTADDLRSSLFGSRHDLVFLAGHFSTGSALAADYKTRLTAAEVAASDTADFLNTLIFSVGCHSGYNTVDFHAIPGITNDPDWAQAFAGKGATLIAGTGYQYGDTEFIEYSERLYLEFARQLRTGTGPISVGKALVEAKREYLIETPLMRGIHEKSLIQATLFGLPMLKVNVPGSRIIPAPSSTPLNPVPSSVGFPNPGPGLLWGLEAADVTIDFETAHPISGVAGLTESSIPLNIVGSELTVDARWFTGRTGRSVSTPAEPTRPLEVYGVSAADTLLRGVGFRGGSYADIADFLPLTGAPTTEIRGVYGNFFSEVFYPIQPYNLNFLGAICNGTEGERLNVYPTQYLNVTNDTNGGTLRKFGNMDFRLFYNDNRETLTNSYVDQNGVTVDYEIIPALAPAPSIIRVRSALNAGGDAIRIEVNVAGHPSVGIHEVWVTFTGVAGSPLHGQWQSIDLLQQDSGDSTLWSHDWALPAEVSADEIRFMVQAASGTGLVALSSNRGYFYQVESDEPSGRELSSIGFDPSLPVPPNGNYGDNIPVKAKLVDATGTALVGKSVGIRLGTNRVIGLTDADGTVSVTLPLKTSPANNLLLQAYFQGDATHKPSSTSESFDLFKQDTVLAFVNPPDPSSPVFGPDIVVQLSDVRGTPLKERTVFFLVDYGDGTKIGKAVITDLSGRADLSDIMLRTGSATITVYFNEVVLPDDTSVTISDNLYNPATPVSISATLADPNPELTLDFEPKKIEINYVAKKSNGKAIPPPLYSSAKIEGNLSFPEPTELSDLQNGANDSKYVTATIEAILAGQVIATETVQLEIPRNQDKYWKLSKSSGDTVSDVRIYWNKGSDNPLEEGQFILDLKTVDGMAQPGSDSTPNQFEFRFILGDEGAKQYTATGTFGEGIGFTPWTSETAWQKQYWP